MQSIKGRFAILAAASAALVAGAAPAMAAGCNGVVNPLVWGCAPWDNNNGPQFAYYVNPRTNQIKIPLKGQPQIRVQNGQQQVLHNNQWLGVIANGGGNVIANGAGN